MATLFSMLLQAARDASAARDAARAAAAAVSRVRVARRPAAASRSARSAAAAARSAAAAASRASIAVREALLYTDPDERRRIDSKHYAFQHVNQSLARSHVTNPSSFAQFAGNPLFLKLLTLLLHCIYVPGLQSWVYSSRVRWLGPTKDEILGSSLPPNLLGLGLDPTGCLVMSRSRSAGVPSRRYRRERRREK